MRLVSLALGICAVVMGCRGSVDRLYDDDGAPPVVGDDGCPMGGVACDAVCTSLASDPRHCGSCGAACGQGEVCGDGRCSATCPSGQDACNGACVDLLTNASSCGVCGNACGVDHECADGKCVIACRTQLNQPITDPWGWSWDGFERAPSAYGDAVASCTEFRGRLPTATELYRASATQSATVGQSTHTNPLWSLAPASPGVHMRARLSDAVLAGEADTTKTHYRCVCPPPLPKIFAANNCHGTSKANGCATLEAEGKSQNIDLKDRPAVPKGAAVWECAFYGGHLATPLQLTEAVQQDIGAGSGDFLHTANEIRNDFGALVSWTDGTGFAFQYTAAPNSLSWSAPTDLRPFRCIGENVTPTTLPAVGDQWVGAARRKTEAADWPEAKFIDAIDHCFDNGGHLPTMAELNELVVHGAPNGSDAFLWSSDQTGFDGNNFTVAVTKWKAIDTGHLYGGGNMSWGYRTATHPYRCVYYPVNPGYAGPQASACAGGCTTIALPGASGAKSWFDSVDREGATTTAAIDMCRKLGGHLPSERDLTEAIRGGLPNGKSVFLQTSDPELGVCGSAWNAPCPGGSAPPNIIVGTVRWTDTMPTFDDQWENSAARRADWAWAFTVSPYRCMWTNELR